MSCRLQMKHKLYIKMKVNGVATAIPETIKVSDNDLSKSLTGHKSRSETKREVINSKSKFLVMIVATIFILNLKREDFQEELS